MKKNVFTHVKILTLTSMCVMGLGLHADIDVNLMVEGCNNDTVCEIQYGESFNSCPNDCAYVAPTSTPPTPVTPLPSADSSGILFGTKGDTTLRFENVHITHGLDSAVLTWNTTRPTKSSISWGLTDDYAEGVLSEIEFIKTHSSKINNIIPGKIYVFKITAVDADGVYVTYSGNFLLKKETPVLLPLNVADFRIFTAPTGIGLRWNNVSDLEYEYVRIIRSTTGYPHNPSDGKVVYEGKGQSFVDINVLEGVRYYYAAFVRNQSSQYSSGVLRTVIKYKNGITPLDSDVGFPFENDNQIDTAIPSNVFQLTHQDIDFIQNNTKISFISSVVPVNSSIPLIVSVPKFNNSVVFLTMTSSDQTYLFAYNVSDDRLEVQIPSLHTDNSIEYFLYILNDGTFYKLNQGTFDLSPSVDYTDTRNGKKRAQNLKDFLIIIPIAVFLIAIKLIYRIFKK